MLRSIGLLFALLWFATSAQATEPNKLTIVTSYPPTFFEPFQKAFEQANPDLGLTIIQRNTSSASRFIADKPDQPADIFWASAADAFELLKRSGSLRKIKPRPTGAPDKLFGYPVNDPDGYYLGFALSGYGFVYNAAYLAQHGLLPPRDWQELLDPAYAGHIGITTPSRSGTTHLMVEALLQTYGWAKGWAMLSRLGGNLSTVTARSFGVASGVAQRRFGIGITIDFLARTPDISSSDAVFVMPPDTVFVPASIAILSRARNVDAAERFIDFILSDKGQRILLDPSVGRIPVIPTLNRDLLPDDGEAGLLGNTNFNAGLSAQRYGLVNLIFDDYIVRRRAVLARLWKRLAELEAMNIASPETLSLLARARRSLETPPISDAEASQLDDALRAKWPRPIERSPAQAEFAARLRASIERNLSDAETLIAAASGKSGLRSRP